MGTTREPLDGAEKTIPLAAHGRELSAARRRQAVVAAFAARARHFPRARDPGALFEHVEHGIERRECEAQLTGGALGDGLRDLVAVQAFLGQHREDGEFCAAAFDLRDDHDRTEYRNPIYGRAVSRVPKYSCTSCCAGILPLRPSRVNFFEGYVIVPWPQTSRWTRFAGFPTQAACASSSIPTAARFPRMSFRPPPGCGCFPARHVREPSRLLTGIDCGSTTSSWARAKSSSAKSSRNPNDNSKLAGVYAPLLRGWS